jgi:hypothetical protein
MALVSKGLEQAKRGSLADVVVESVSSGMKLFILPRPTALDRCLRHLARTLDTIPRGLETPALGPVMKSIEWQGNLEEKCQK